jgi:hypothetical protein
LLDAVTKEEHLKPFYLAANGMINFLEGHVEAGRQYYEDAILGAKKAGKRDLIVNAIIFYLEREAAAGSMPATEIRKVMGEIEAVLPRLKASDQKDLNKIWSSRREAIELSLAQGAFQLEGGENRPSKAMALASDDS